MRKRLQWAHERLLDDESLRSDLTDDEAQVLLDWALARATKLVDETASVGNDDDARNLLRESLRPLAGAVRSINRLLGCRGERTEPLHHELKELFEQLTSHSLPPGFDQNCRALAADLPKLAKSERMRRILALAEAALT